MPAPRLKDDSHAFIVRLVDALRPLGAPAAVQAEAARLLGTHLGVNRATYAEIDGDWAVLRGRYADGVPPLPERLPLSAFGSVLVDEGRRGRMIAIDDVRTDPRVSDGARLTFEAIDMRSVATVVLVKEGRWVAAFGVDSAAQRAWTDDERDLVCEVADRTWAAAEQLRAEAALRESEARHRRLFQTMEEGFAFGELVRDEAGQPADWRFLFVNDALERLSGLRPEDVVGRLGSEVFPGEYRDWLGILADVVDTQRAQYVERGSTIHGRVWRAHFAPYGNDRYAALYADITQRKQADEDLRASAARQAELLEAVKAANDALEQRVLDRTAQLAATNDALEREVRERRLAEQQIQALFRRLVSAQEEERRRIARDIHDQVGQQMTALRMHLEALRGRAEQDPALWGQIERTQGLAEELDQSIDFLAWQLRPSTLDHLGLAASLQGLVRGWAERFGIVAEFETSAPDLRLAPDVETNLYRIVQEALHNVVKHAHAGSVSVLLSCPDHHAVLVIEDDGRGFDAANLATPQGVSGFGLISMRQRAALAGGELEVDSTPGTGTSIFVRVPLPVPGIAS
jgi:PAS domain S-box-containing protein